MSSPSRSLLPLPSTARQVAPAPDPNDFTFIVAGDNRAAGRGVPMPPTAGEIFTEARILRPAFVLWTGDTIYGSEEPVAEAADEYAGFLKLAASASVPVYNAPGNHEIFQRPEMQTLYEKKMGRLYGSFDYGNSHFIALDTERIGKGANLGSQEMEWLKQDLEQHRASRNIFAFMHHPLFAKDAKDGFRVRSERDALHALFVRYGVKNVFSGHEHLFYKSVHQGVSYWVSGGSGAPADAMPDDGGFQHYLLVDVRGS
ncbi:MAG TPA: metallophosphoesterase, partial [Chthonomonadales bacterium]|nr:metallophosphoesterase [Chthonomonadales bacterium]